MVFGSIQTNLNYFTGDIAEVQIYNGALTGDQASALGHTLDSTYGTLNPDKEIYYSRLRLQLAQKLGQPRWLVVSLISVTHAYCIKGQLDSGIKYGLMADSVAEAFVEPQVIARGMRVNLAAPDTQAGTIPSVRTPIVFSDAELALQRPSPRLGQHTTEVKNELGLL